MKKILLSIALLSVVTITNAVPNVWKQSIDHGFYSFVILNENSDYLSITCDLNNEPAEIMELKVIHKGKTIRNTNKLKPLSFYIDNKDSYNPLLKPKLVYVDGVEWNEFVTKLPSAKKVEVYSNNKLLFTLKPRNNNSDEIMTLTECKI